MVNLPKIHETTSSKSMESQKKKKQGKISLGPQILKKTHER